MLCSLLPALKLGVFVGGGGGGLEASLDLYSSSSTRRSNSPYPHPSQLQLQHTSGSSPVPTLNASFRLRVLLTDPFFDSERLGIHLSPQLQLSLSIAACVTAGVWQGWRVRDLFLFGTSRRDPAQQQ
jgi:hypothetical protein